MQSIKILCIGKLKEKFFAAACEEYQKRLSGCKLEILELPEERLPERPSEKQIADGLAKEGALLRAKIPNGCYSVALCVEGKKLSSPAFANTVFCNEMGLRDSVAFLIGSSYGLSEETKKRADLQLSFSDMTFPHQLMRVILLEQIYRAHKILENSTYHK